MRVNRPRFLFRMLLQYRNLFSGEGEMIVLNMIAL